MELRHLRLFLKVLEHGSLSTAANELGMHQPNLSKQISRLEEELATELLDRLPRGVQPNVYGKILGHYARTIDANYRSALRHIDSVRNATAGEITVGAGLAWRYGYLPHAVTQLLRKHPGTRVKIEAGVPDALLSQLLRGDVDMILAPVAVEESVSDHIDCRTLVSNELTIIASQDHPMADGRPRSIVDLSSLEWVLPPGTFVRHRFDHLFELHGIVPPEPVVEVDDIFCLLKIVANSQLVTYGSILAPVEDQWSNLTTIPCPDAETQRDTGVILRKSDTIPPLCHELIKELEEIAGTGGDATTH